MSRKAKERWIAIDDIPGIAAKDEIIIVRPDFGILITRWLPPSKYSDLKKFRLRMAPVDGKDPEPYPYPPTVVGSSGSPVGEPIAASSDESALFELIHSAGGRMPEA